MSNYQLKTPVAFVIFNRPDTTKSVFAEIAKARPPKLLVIADGPRVDHPEDAGKCAAARAIIDGVDWDCEVLTNYSDMNMGCKRRVSNGLDWVFDTVEEAIILEDDCLPHPTFFRFCEELLEKYRDDARVMHIGGTNIFSKTLEGDTYGFTKYVGIWGWATWRRAWKLYDVNIEFGPGIKKAGYISKNFSKLECMIHEQIFDDVYNNKIDTWDYQWSLCVMLHGLAIYPNVNLISNFGFNKDATHTFNKSDHRMNLKTGEMAFPLVHPACCTVNIEMEKMVSTCIIKMSWTYIIKKIFNSII